MRKVVEAKVRKKAKKIKLVKKKKKKRLEYFQQLQNEILAKDATLLGSTKSFQITRTKYKEITTEDKKR